MRRGELRTAGARPARLGGAARRRAARRARRAGRGRGARARRRCWTRSRPRPRRSGPRRTAAAATCSRAEDLADARVAADLRAAAGELRALAAADPALLGTPRGRCSTRSARAPRCASRSAADAAARRAARRPARDPRAPLPRGLRLRPPGRRASRAGPRPSRSSPTTTGAGSRARPGCGCRCTRTCSTASARCSTPPSRGPRTCCSSPGARRTRRATRSPPSPFLDDVRALFTDELWEERGTRLLADVTWAPRDAPTPHELRRAYAAAAAGARAAPLGAPATDAVLGAARRAPRPSRRAASRRSPPAASLARRAAAAPRPDRARPRADAARLARPRGARAHARAAARAHGLGADRARAARRRARGAARRARAERARARAAGRAAARCCAAWRPTSSATCARRPSAAPATSPRELEWSFGGERDAHRPLAARRRRRCVTGRVDRVDVGPGGAAIVRDYKGRTVAGGAKWADEQQLQVALYLLAVRELLGLEPVAGLYQPLAGRKLGRARARPRRRARRATRAPTSSTPTAFDAALEEARELAARTAADLHAGRLAPVPRALLEPRLPLPGDLPRGRADGARCRRRERASRPSSAPRSPTAAARRCSPPAPAPARPR